MKLNFYYSFAIRAALSFAQAVLASSKADRLQQTAALKLIDAAQAFLDTFDAA